MAGMEVGAGAFDFAKQTVDSSRNGLEASLKAIRGVIDETRGIWKGSAADSFQKLMAEWDQDVKKTVDALEEYIANLERMKKGYASTEEESVASLQRAAASADYSGSF